MTHVYMYIYVAAELNSQKLLQLSIHKSQQYRAAGPLRYKFQAHKEVFKSR